MNRINPIDFGELLEEMGYVVQDDTGEVYTPVSYTHLTLPTILLV